MHAINRKDLEQLMDDRKVDFVLINVLPADAFNQQHIRNSINIPLKTERFDQLVETVVGDKERRVVVYCASFDCDASTKAATELEAEGFTKVYDYEGGTKDWFENSAAV